MKILEELNSFKNQISQIFLIYNKDLIDFKLIKKKFKEMKLVDIGFTNKLDQIYKKCDFIIGGLGYDSLKRLANKKLSINIKLAENQTNNFLFFKKENLDLLNSKKLNYNNLKYLFFNYPKVLNRINKNFLIFEKKLFLNHEKFKKVWKKISAK